MDDTEKGAFYRDCLERRIGWLKDSIAKVHDDASTVVFHARRASWYSQDREQVMELVKAADAALGDARVQLRDVMGYLNAPIAEAAE